MNQVWSLFHRSRANCQSHSTLLLSLAFLIWWSSLPHARAEQVYGFPSLPASLSPLVQGSDGAFYGTTASSGSQGYGAVFRVTTNGDLTTLVSFAGTNGASPASGLMRASDGNFYGTTERGGSWDMGTVFRLTTNGVLTTLVSIDGAFMGAWPRFGLVQGSDGFLYGSTYSGMFRISLEGDLTPVATFGSGSESPLVEVGNGIFYGLNTLGGDNHCGSVFQVATNGVVTTLASFNHTNGAYPCGGLVAGPDGALYGTASQGGSADWGTLFRVTTNGLLTVLFSFQETDNGQRLYIYDGGSPSAGMVLGRDGQLYGTTFTGGTNGGGTVFQVTTNGLLRTLASFEGDGWMPPSPTALVQGTDGAFYGATDNGGPNNIGSVFRVTTNGALTTLFGFTNTEGAHPQAGLALGDDGALYSSTPAGGDHNFGAVFRVTTNGVVSTLVSFNNSGAAGWFPRGALVRANDGMLYGTASGGGAEDRGMVFRVTTNGVLTGLASFAAGGTAGAGLIQASDSALYGTTYVGGLADCGTVFRVTTNGDLITLASFFNTNGALPSGPLVQGCDGALYGVTARGGPGATNIGMGFGTIFRVTTNGVLTTLLALDSTNRIAPDAGLVLGDDCALYGTAGETLFRLTTEGQVTPVASVTGGPLASLSKGPDGAFYATSSSNGCIVICRFSTNGVMTTVTSLPGAGAQPRGSLVAAPDGFLYGVASQGGSRGGGSIFRARLPDFRLRMHPIQFPCGPGPSGYVSVTFSGEPGKTYRVLRATNLSGPWQSLGQVTTSPDGLGRLDDAPSPPNGAFYRVAAP